MSSVANTNTNTEEALDAGTYAVRLRDLQQRVDELKERIFRSKARLSLLAETVIAGAVGGAQGAIVHENKMSRMFRLVRAVYALDGAPILSRDDGEEGDLGVLEEFQVYEGGMVAGEHTLTVLLEYRGRGLPYLEGYQFTVRSSYSFTAPEGQSVVLRVIGYEKGGAGAAVEERPALRFVERVGERGALSLSSGNTTEEASEESLE